MKHIVKIGYIILSLAFFIYLSFPNYVFPNQPDGALYSNEPADTEDSLRRAYFTNFTREEVMDHYKNEFKIISFLKIPFFTYRLNYPPEEAQTIIRDQTRSTFLEEIVHPFRESVFVNGFEPKDPKDAVIIQDKVWRQKIIIRQVNSSVFVRFMLGLLSVILTPLVLENFLRVCTDIKQKLLKLWIYR